MFWLLVDVDKGRDVCTSLDYRSTGWQAAHNIPLSTPPSPLPQLSSDPIACYGVGLHFQRIPNIFLAKSHRLSYFKPLSLQICPLTPALSQFVFLSFPLFLLFESIIFLSFAFPLFPPSSPSLSPPRFHKTPLPSPSEDTWPGRILGCGTGCY